MFFTKKCVQLGLFSLTVFAGSNSFLLAEDTSELTNSSKLEYQHAAKFSYLHWPQTVLEKLPINVKSMANFSGIPANADETKSEYYEHGKIPHSIDLLFTDLIRSSHFFAPTEVESDIQFELILNRYSHPFAYAPDDHWYKSLRDEVDRWNVTKKNASVSLSLRISHRDSRFKPWMRTIETVLSQCDLNQKSQPLGASLYHDDSLLAYSNSTVGQAFIAASNYLILRGMEHLNTAKQQAKVVGLAQNELQLFSTSNTFVVGEQYDLYFHESNHLSLPAGKVQVVKTLGDQAVAYPVNLRVDHIKIGDWVEVGSRRRSVIPKHQFESKNQCATVSVATL